MTYYHCDGCAERPDVDVSYSVTHPVVCAGCGATLTPGTNIINRTARAPRTWYVTFAVSGAGQTAREGIPVTAPDADTAAARALRTYARYPSHITVKLLRVEERTNA